MSKEELREKLREETERSEKNAKRRAAQQNSRKQQKIAEQTRKQLPPQSPVRKQREEEMKKRAEREKREKRRRKRGSYIVYYVILGIIAAVTFVILSMTVLFNTEQIVVEGVSEYSDEQIIAASGLQGDENLVKLNTSGIPEKILDKLVKLDSVRVDKQFPSTIKITVEPAVPMASFRSNGKYYVISHIGRVIDISDDTSDCMQIIGYIPAESVILGSFITAEDPEQDTLVSQISEALEKAGIDNITTVNITDKLDIVLSYDDRIELCIGSILQLDEKMRIAHELLYKGYISDTDRVTLDISDTSKAIQRPITIQAITAAPAEQESDTSETDENGSPVEENTDETAETTSEA